MSIRRTFSFVALVPCVVFALTAIRAVGSVYLPFDLAHTGVHAALDVGMMDPGPGTDGSASLCINGPTVQLITYLGDSPDPGGVWTGPSATTGSFTPGTNVAGVYTYTQGGSSATVTVSVSNLSNAGTSATAPICSNAAPFALISKLTGTPQNTGAWTGPLNTSVSDTYTPGTSTPGIYTYTVPGISPCPSATATVTVQETTAPKAGTNTTINVCSSDASFPMRPRLNGSPDPGGSWVGPDGPHGTDFNPVSDTPGAYVYTVPGTGPCANASATLTIQIVGAASAGTNGTITLCSTDGQYPLFSSLGGTPNVGGSWLGPTNAVHNGTFIPGTDAAGVYTYSVLGITPCPPVSATVTVTVRAAANAGVGSSVSYCSDHAVVDLFTVLTGGPTTGGTWAGPGGSTSANFDPATSQPGAYTYTVAGQLPCPNATATINVSVVPRANAGTNATVSKCSIDPSFSLFNSLGGSPATGGTWTPPPGGPTTGTFIPGTSPAGVYTYTVIGNSPCTNGTATVTVNVTNAPIPGTNTTITRCSNAADVNLFLQLGGSPQSGGTWTRPDGTPHNGTYLPASQPGGNYTYTVAGTGPCAARSAIVQVVRVVAPNAGSNGNITVCSSDGPFEMIDVLGSSPSGTGTWRAPNGTTVTGEFTPGTSVAGTYKYVVVGAVPCANDTGFVTVNVNPAPNAGTNTTITVCSDAATFPLFTQLGGTPQTGGTWTDPLGASYNGSFIPGTSLPGGYTYRRTGDTPCLAATAVVVVNVNRKPVAGTNGSFTRCSTDASVNLFTILGGTPDGGGVWTGPGTVTNGIFIPGTSTPGTYTYTVSGTAPCTNATATVIANVNMAPNAGTGGTITICPGSPSVNLFNGITGTPDLTGTWTELTTPGHVSGSFFDPAGLSAGNYDVRYTVSGGGPCGSANTVVRVTIVPSLNAGSSGSTSACGSNTQVDLFNGLGGSPQAGGTWINLGGTGTLTGQFFNASSVPPGTYLFRYRLSGIAGCPSDSAQVTLNIVEAPRAGNPGSTSTCSSAVPFSLFALLGGNPMSGGIWHIGNATGPIMSGSYDPTTNASGIFTYVVNGAAPCTSVTSTITVTEIQGANAGSPASRSVCSNGAQFNMTNALGGTPDPGGQWWFNSNQHGPTFVPGLDQLGVYEYRVQGQAPCPMVTASLSVTVSEAADAGLNSSVTYCDGAGAQNMFFALTGGPDNGGSWRGITGANHSASFDPALDPIGNYKYIVLGNAPCVNDTAVLSVFLDPSPDAGGNGTAQLCINGPAVNLINYLTGTPGPFGTWVGPAPANPAFSGTFTPGTSVAGTYRYRVVNSCGTDSATVVVTVSTPANAGCSASINKCSSEGAFDMRAALGCNAVTGGTWTGPAPATGGVFTPGTSTPGVHTYTLGAVGGCAASSSTLTVAVFPVRNAGVDATRNLCRTDGQLQMFPLLGTSAQPGGVWRRNGVAHPETIDPATDLSGTYVYFLAANAGCPADSALVQINISTPPNAGNDGVVTLCSSSQPYQLSLSLSGNPQPNGTWTLPNSTTIHSGVFLPASDPPGVYKYKRNGNAGCPADSSYVTVIVNQAVNAGSNGTRQVCSDAPQFHLFDNLGGNPQQGGVWFDPSNSAIAGDLYIPGTSVPGVYKYKLTGIAPCSSDSATVTVTQELAPNAGFSSLLNVCSSSDAFPLIGALGGTPQTGGTWSPLTAQPGIFNPAVDPGGAYTYTKSGISPCGTTTAQVVITLTQQASAGSNGSVSVCFGTTSVPLFPVLNGTPSTGGVWSTSCPQGSLSNGEFNTTGMAAGTSCVITYTQAANGPCPARSAQVTVSVVADLDAGDDSTIQACRSDVISLYSVLGGSPQTGGTWINVDNASGFIAGGVFNTSSVAANTTWHFRYLLPGDSQCPPDSATVTVEVQEGPSAGCDGPTQSRCTSDVSFQMITFLGCSPDAGGSWFGPGPVAHSGTFNPATDVGGLYQYVVAGIGSCAADTSSLLINLTPTAFAGRDSSFLICSSSSILDMRPLLGTGVDPSGVWFRYDAVSTIHGTNYDPALDSTGIFFYVVQSLNACNPDTAWIFAFEYQAVFAGCSADAEICAGNGEWIDLVTLLGCPPSGSGTWTYVTGDTAHSGFFNPAADLAGIYRYTVPADTPCTASEALLTITLIDIGDPGRDTVISVCAGSAVVDLYNLLGTNVTPGGDWNDVDGSGALTDSLFDPALAGNGTWHFQYWIQGNASCPARFSTITVVVGNSGFAGNDSTLVICNSLTTFDLFAALGPAAIPGGLWLSPTGLILHWDSISGILYPSSFDTTGVLPEIVYQVTDPVCGSAIAVLSITISARPFAGFNNAFPSLCFTGIPINLFDTLLARNAAPNEPVPGGIWFNPFGFPDDGIYDPSEEPGGSYKYTFPETIGCESDTGLVTVYLYYPPFAGDDTVTTICVSDTSYKLVNGLGGNPPDYGTWIAPTQATFDALDNGYLDPEELDPAEYEFIYFILGGGCANDTARLRVRISEYPTLADIRYICDERLHTYQVEYELLGDGNGGFLVEGLEGTYSHPDSLPYVFTSVVMAPGELFTATITDLYECGPLILNGRNECDFEVAIFVPESFSPNGDGINESFQIPGIEAYRENTVVIFNRWGNKVFDAAGYDNNTVVWDGTSSKAVVGNSVPAGTYFYVIELDANTDAFKGSIQVVR